MHHPWNIRFLGRRRCPQVCKSLAYSGFYVKFIYSGIMRITVTVVVIMFELTGALTYILPTMASSVDVLGGHMHNTSPLCRSFCWWQKLWEIFSEQTASQMRWSGLMAFLSWRKKIMCTTLPVRWRSPSLVIVLTQMWFCSVCRYDETTGDTHWNWLASQRCWFVWPCFFWHWAN